MEKLWADKIHGKCILAGEHAVLRGTPALVLPVKGKFLKIEYFETDTPLDLECTGKQYAIWDVLATGVIDEACKKLGLKRKELTGLLKLNTNLNLGAGMGASAALCVGIAKYFQFLGFLKEDIYEFARSLEDIFHGESSGVDIAVALEGKAIRFIRSGSKEQLQMNWSPKLYLSYAGNKGLTSECVSQVKSLFKKDEALAKSIDDQMNKAVEAMKDSLTEEMATGLPNFVNAMEVASKCFADWDLLGGGVKETMDKAKSLGALAVKPTGSGNGGYVLSCWNSEPPKDSGLEFILVGE